MRVSIPVSVGVYVLGVYGVSDVLGKVDVVGWGIWMVIFAG